MTRRLAPYLLLWQALGCVEPQESPDHTRSHPMRGALPATASLAELRPEGLAVAPTPDVATVLRATWTTRTACVGAVDYTDAEGVVRTVVEPAAVKRHSLLLLGLPANTEVDGRARCHEGGDRSAEAGFQASTGPLPDDLADFVFEGTPDDGTYAISLMEPTEYALLVDGRGRIVWYHRCGAGSRPSRVWLARDRNHVLVNVQDESPPDAKGDGAVLGITLDGESVDRLPIPSQNHDFLELPDGTVTSITGDVQTYEGASWLGDRLVEAQWDGTSRVVFSVWDALNPVDTPGDATGSSGWTHGNAVEYDPTDDTYWFGLRNLNLLLHIDRADGHVIESLGDSPGATWTFAEPSEAFDGQHQFQFLGDGLLVFDNQWDSHDTRAVEYAMDPTTHTLTQRWAWEPDQDVFVSALGDVDRREDGATRVTLSTEGSMVEVDADGAERWRMSAGIGSMIGYSSRIEGFAPVASHP